MTELGGDSCKQPKGWCRAAYIPTYTVNLLNVNRFEFKQDMTKERIVNPKATE